MNHTLTRLGAANDDEMPIRYGLAHQRGSRVVNGFREACVSFFKRAEWHIGEATGLKGAFGSFKA